jgi:SAM-dependent methyltransferase
MHKGVLDFLKKHSNLYPQGENLKIIDVGSFNVNGSASQIVPVTMGVDMREGPGVDLVLKGEDLPKEFPEEHFDVVVTCDTLEHVEQWRPYILGMWEVLKEGGYFVGTIASRRKGRHAYPDDYWRLNKEILEEIFGDLIDFQELGVSTGWVVQKKSKELPGGDLLGIKMLPVDTKVPEGLQ